MKPKLLQTVVLFLFTLCVGPPVMAAQQVLAFVSIAPQKTFVQQIGKGLLDVRVMVAPGASPATYEPKPKQMAALSKARVYFAVGVPFENAWLKKIAAANPNMKIVHTDHGIDKIPMGAVLDHDNAGQHNERHAHEHGGLDPHVWLSPPLVKLQAGTILNALREIDPAHGDIYQAHHDQFVLDINHLDARLRATFADQQGLRFMVFHPSWGYFAHTYGLEQVPIEIEGKNPKPAQLKKVIQHAREKGIHIIFVQPQFSTKSAQLVAREINGQVVLADPLAEDWQANLIEVAHKFNAALK